MIIYSRPSFTAHAEERNMANAGTPLNKEFAKVEDTDAESARTMPKKSRVRNREGFEAVTIDKMPSTDLESIPLKLPALPSSPPSWARGDPISKPERFDVLLGRGQAHKNHPGNRRLNMLVDIRFKEYDASNSRKDKTQITSDIVHQITECGTEKGRFLRLCPLNKVWFEVDEETARLKVSQSLRYERRLPAAQGKPSSDSETSSRESTAGLSTGWSRFDLVRCNAHQNQDIRRSILLSPEQIWNAIGLTPEDVADAPRSKKPDTREREFRDSTSR